MDFTSIPIVTNPNLTVQFRFPRSKKKRIRNKWASRPNNRKPDRHFYIIDGKYFCHPAVLNSVISQLAQTYQATYQNLGRWGF